MFYIHQRLDPAFEELLQRAVSSETLTREDGTRLISAQRSELSALMLAASTVRDQGKGRTVTYSRNVFIPLTNLCRQKCGYCTFAKGPKDPAALTLSPDQVLALAEAGRQRGCKEALFSLGEKPEE
ncbi:MAG: 7,8-didemethyl-8-hydroxy-5-deazariboflavin synthase subunit CofG, partial [Chloroflexi bacterium]|nr:7,8-didemethyl-8-hydroxy-5-deazariboflavin synthase subunit CofG [Chloroflexota bacterium]